MNDRCERIRERIEDSIGRDLGAEELAALDRHCAECESCRVYRERLIDDHSRLDTFAALHSTSEARFEERLIEMLPAKTPVRARHPGFRGRFARVPGAVRIVVAAAAAVVVVAGIDLLLGARNGPVPAFATVIEKMEKAENVVFRHRQWILGTWRTTERGNSQSGCSRIQWADSIHIRHYSEADTTRDICYDTTLAFYPATKRAILQSGAFVPQHQRFRQMMSHASSPEERARYQRLNAGAKRSSVQRMASWHRQEGFSFLRRERREGKNSAVYVSRARTGGHYGWTTWVDLDTGLPFRIEIVSQEIIRFGLQLSDFAPAGTPPSTVAGWTALGPGEPRAIFDDFRWNTKLDTAYFSLTPPSGYGVSWIAPLSEEESADWERRWQEGVPYEAGELAKALSIWASFSRGVFPDDIHDLGDSIKVRRLLIEKHDKDGIPGEELREAIKDGRQLEDGFRIVSSYTEDGRLHYFGKGISLGDSTRIVCWGEMTGFSREFFAHPYWIIYADCRCVPSKTPPIIPKK